MKQTRLLCPKGPDVKKQDNAEVPKTMPVGQLFRIVQVVAPGAAPSFVLLPTALVQTPAQTSPGTVRPTRPKGPDDTVDKTGDRTRKLTDAEVTTTDDRTRELTDAEVTKTVDETQTSTDTVDAKTADGTQALTDAGVEKTVDGTQTSTGTSCKMLARFGGKRRRKNTCTRPVKNNISQFPALKDYLPASCDNTSYDYHVCHYQTISETSDHINFRATLRMALSSEDEIKQWLKSHTVTWRVERSRKSKGDRVLFKVDYRCQHNTKHNPKPENFPAGSRIVTSKNTNCPAKMTVTILRTRTKVSRGRPSISSDPHVPAFPTMVSICSEHNHTINGTEALRYRDVGDKARERLLKLFEAGHNPSSALEALKIDLQVEHGENYAAAIANKELCPTLEFCYRLRHKLYGKLDGRSTHRRVSSLPGSQKKRQKKKKACPDVQQCVTSDEEQTDDLMQGQSSQQNPSQGDPGTNQEECEAESAADFLWLALPSDYEEDTVDLVENMIRDISTLRKHPIYRQAIAAMAKQFHHIKSDQSRLLSAMHCFGKAQPSSRRTATTRRHPCQPAATPRPVTKLSAKRSLPSVPQQTHSSPGKRPRMMDYHI